MTLLTIVLFWFLIFAETLIGAVAFIALMISAGLQYVVNFLCDTARKLRR